MKVKLLLTFALLLTAVTGAWADVTPQPGDEWDSDTKTLTVNSNPDVYSYAGESDIQYLVIASGVTTIDDGAFFGCIGLTTVTIPASVTNIGYDAFYGCTEVTDVYCDADPAALTWNENGCNDFKYDGTTIVHVADADSWYAKFAGVVNGIFRDPSTILFTWAYDPDTKTLTLSGTETIPSYRDSNDRPWNDKTSEIKNIVIEDGVKGIGKNAFQDCTGLTSVTFASGSQLTSIGDGAFYHCSSLPSITIPASVTFIGDFAFQNCSGLTSIEIPASVKSIGTLAFGACRNLATLTVAAGNTVYDSRNGCNAIIEKETNTLIAGCNGTTIPASVTSIGGNAFYDSGLTTITIPASVTYIGYDAFFNCEAVTDVYCNADPAALTWNEGSCDDFKRDGSTIIHVADADSWYAKFAGVVNGIFRDSSPVTPFDWTYNSTTKTLTLSGTEPVLFYDSEACPWKDHVAEVENIVIKDGMKGIGPNAFAYNYSALTSVTIPASVTFIGGDAFSGCISLTTVTFDGTPTLTRIGGGAFCACSALTSITIPASVKSIGEWAFQDCSNLAMVTLNSNPYIGDGVFDYIASDATVTMNLKAHEGATGEYWMTFCSRSYNFEADTNTKVFTAELSDNSLTLTELTDDKIVPLGIAVILKSTSSSIVMTLTETESNNNFSYNYLYGVYDPAGEKSDGNYYVLNKGAQGVGFYKLADGSTLGYGKAYLRYSGSSSSSFFGFDETTGVNEVRGQMEDVRGEYYDLQGRRVAQPTKGLYIVNGKKVVIK